MIKAVGNILNGKSLKGIGAGSMLGMGLNAYFGMDTYQTAREEGSSKLGATGKAVGEMVMADVLGMPAYIGMQLIPAAAKGAVAGYSAINKQTRGMNRGSRNAPFANANFIDNQQAYTMRQAGMQLARESKYNMQQTMLGNEAQNMHY